MNKFERQLFMENDYHIVRTILKSLPRSDQEIIFLRFWGNYSIEEIAGYMGRSWNFVDKRISKLLKHFKARCLLEPNFSQNKKIPFAA